MGVVAGTHSSAVRGSNLCSGLPWWTRHVLPMLCLLASISQKHARSIQTCWALSCKQTKINQWKEKPQGVLVWAKRVIWVRKTSKYEWHDCVSTQITFFCNISKLEDHTKDNLFCQLVFLCHEMLERLFFYNRKTKYFVQLLNLQFGVHPTFDFMEYEGELKCYILKFAQLRKCVQNVDEPHPINLSRVPSSTCSAWSKIMNPTLGINNPICSKNTVLGWRNKQALLVRRNSKTRMEMKTKNKKYSVFSMQYFTYQLLSFI